MCRNTEEYRESSFEDKMKFQYKNLTFDKLEKQVKIIGVFIVDDNRYIYHILNCMNEEFYIVNKNNCLKMKIKESNINKDDNLIREYTCGIGECRTISFNIYFKYLRRNQNESSSRLAFWQRYYI